MKVALKTLVALITIVVGCFLGIVLLSGLVWWKILVFAWACAIIGQLVYNLLRAIDKKYSSK